MLLMMVFRNCRNQGTYSKDLKRAVNHLLSDNHIQQGPRLEYLGMEHPSVEILCTLSSWHPPRVFDWAVYFSAEGCYAAPKTNAEPHLHSRTIFGCSLLQVSVSQPEVLGLAIARPSHRIHAMAQARRSMHGCIHREWQSANEAKR